MAREPARWDYAAAQIPSALTEEMEKAEQEKGAQRAAQVENERKKREKKKKAKGKGKQKAAQGSGSGEDEGEDENEDGDGDDDDAGGRRGTKVSAAGAKVLAAREPGVHLLNERGAPKVKQGSEAVERERRARAAEQRLATMAAASGAGAVGPACASCQRPLQGLVPF